MKRLYVISDGMVDTLKGAGYQFKKYMVQEMYSPHQPPYRPLGYYADYIYDIDGVNVRVLKDRMHGHEAQIVPPDGELMIMLLQAETLYD